MDNDVTPVQETCFQIIIYAGDAKAAFATALREAAKGNTEEADRLYKEGVDAMNQAHRFEADLMAAFGQNVEAVPVDLLLIHANDHLSMALSMQELCDEMRPIVEIVYELKNKLA